MVPARSKVDVPTQVVFQKLPLSADDGLWGTEPSNIKPSLHVSQTLIPRDRWTDLPVGVMNVSEQPITLKSGITVADLQPLEIVNDETSSASIAQDCEQTVPKRVDDAGDKVPESIEKLVDDVDDCLPESAYIALREILKDHIGVFSQSEYDLGRTDIITHQIETGDSRAFRQPLWRYLPAHVEAISKHVDSMLNQDIIEPAASPWASNAVLVKKTDGSLRCCIDNRQLNSASRKDAYPLPCLDTCLDAMSSASWFSTFDLSYHQVMIEPKDRDKTAFICHRGMYRYRMMPFGLSNAGTTFQRMMDIVLSGLHLDVCLVYLDDIIIFSKMIEEHLERLVTVLDRLKSAGLKLKPEKCSLFRRPVSFLGHVLLQGTIATDPAKTKAVSEWPTLASYYRRFVKGFADIAAPLHALTKKSQIFSWPEEAQTAFERLKEALTSSPVLAMPNDIGEMIIDTDASDRNIGCVLSQIQDGVEKVIVYASRSLDKRESNYCVTMKELLAVVYFVKYFRKFRVRTDHAALTWLRRTPESIGQQARWLEILEEFDYFVKHRPGVKHGNADALSRRPWNVKSCVCQQKSDVMSVSDMNSEQPVASTFSAGPADLFAPAVTEVEIGIEDNGVSVRQVNEHEEISQKSGWFGDDQRVA